MDPTKTPEVGRVLPASDRGGGWVRGGEFASTSAARQQGRGAKTRSSETRLVPLPFENLQLTVRKTDFNFNFLIVVMAVRKGRC